MLIGLISDTHIPDRARILPQNVIEAFSDCSGHGGSGKYGQGPWN